MSAADCGRSADAAGAALGGADRAADGARCAGVFHAVFRDLDGREIWRAEARNLWTAAGKNDVLDKYLAGSSYTAAWYMGLISGASYSALAAADTMASHAGWLEAGGTNAPAYSESARRTIGWNAASGGSKSMSAAATFTLTANGTVKGLFVASSATKDGTTGVLFSEALFTGGDQTITGGGGTLTVTYTPSLT